MGDRIRVVLVEDNEVFRKTLELLLELRGRIEVVASVGTGAEAIEACTRLDVDVAVVDYRMPGLDGIQTAAGILSVSPGTDVVCLTASIPPGEVKLILEAGAVACITKDEELDRIVAAIHAAAAPGGVA